LSTYAMAHNAVCRKEHKKSTILFNDQTTAKRKHYQTRRKQLVDHACSSTSKRRRAEQRVNLASIEPEKSQFSSAASVQLALDKDRRRIAYNLRPFCT
jgi:hypothetical protein